MANFLFEQMTNADAASYDGADDELFFLTGSPASVQVTYAAANGLQTDSLTLTSGAVSHTFSADGLGGETLHFFSNSSDQSTLALGFNDAVDTVTVSGVAGSSARYYGLGGNDVITGSNANDAIYGGEGNDTITAGAHGTTANALATEADYFNGGNGADSITGSVGNDHIYGNTVGGAAGSNDLGDTINAGDGNDYVNGNAGADSILGGNGNDHLFGGADNDTINGGLGVDDIQGNKGLDNLSGGDGNDVIHGGADNDALLGNADNDQLFGDKGDDNVTGGAGYDQLTGGAGNDTFTFAAGDANITNFTTAATAAGHGLTDSILDFTHGSDHVNFGFTGIAATVLYQAAGVSFTTSDAALTYAQGLINADATANPSHVHDVAAITVGTDTYLFYNDTAAGSSNTIDASIKLVGLTASATTFSSSDIVGVVA